MSRRTGLTCVRHTLCVINALMWIMGCSVLGVGIWLRLAYGGYASLLHQYAAVSADSLCLAAGVITFLLAFCGCCGAWFQNRCLLVTYFALLAFVFALEVTAGGLLFAYRDHVGSTVILELKAGLKRIADETDKDPVSLTWRHLQTTFQCCGVEGPSDWYDITAWPERNWVPQSCCSGNYSADPVCGRSGVEEQWYTAGCYAEVKMWFVQRLHIVGITALIFAFIQLFGLIASMLLFCTLGRKKQSRTYKSYSTES